MFRKGSQLLCATAARLYFTNIAVVCIPERSKAARGGEDAYFVHKSSRAIGVADGVGSWVERGVDPAAYPRELMRGAYDEAERLSVESESRSLSPMDILNAAWKRASKTIGSCTVDIAAFVGEDQCGFVHLGDSGTVVVRNREILHQTVEQQHRFNCPFQLGTDSDSTPRLAERAVLTMQPGDLIVLGTDGLFDNVADGELLRLLQPLDGGNAGVSSVASEVAQKARHNGDDTSCQSPWGAKACLAYRRQVHFGGKPDDITVIVAVVGEKKCLAFPSPLIDTYKF